MAYDCSGNLIRFFGTVNVSLLPLWKMFRGYREQFQQVTRAGLEPGPPDCDFITKIKKQHQTKQNRKKIGDFLQVAGLYTISYFF